MKRTIYIQSHGYSLENILTMISCVGALVLFLYNIDNSLNVWFYYGLIIFAFVLSLLSIESVFSTVIFKQDSKKLIVTSSWPISFQRTVMVNKNKIEKFYVKTEERRTYQGILIKTHSINVKLKNREKILLSIPRSHEEAKSIKRVLSSNLKYT